MTFVVSRLYSVASSEVKWTGRYELDVSAMHQYNRSMSLPNERDDPRVRWRVVGQVLTVQIEIPRKREVRGRPTKLDSRIIHIERSFSIKLETGHSGDEEVERDSQPDD